MYGNVVHDICIVLSYEYDMRNGTPIIAMYVLID